MIERRRRDTGGVDGLARATWQVSSCVPATATAVLSRWSHLLNLDSNHHGGTEL
jgi:hypothetical protein